jgi:hypothetical protein
MLRLVKRVRRVWCRPKAVASETYVPPCQTGKVRTPRPHMSSAASSEGSCEGEMGKEGKVGKEGEMAEEVSVEVVVWRRCGGGGWS